MKKIIIIFISFIFGTSQAEYTLKLPLEKDQGGYLPSSSIKINQQTQENPNNKICIYHPLAENNASLWINVGGVETGLRTRRIQWEGEIIFSVTLAESYDMTSYENNGYRYTRGGYIINGHFEICREHI